MYWQLNTTIVPLDSIPQWVDTVIIAFATIRSDSTLSFPIDDMNIMTSIQALQSKNQTVLLSIGGAANCGPKGIVEDQMFGMDTFNSLIWADSTITLINMYNFDGAFTVNK